MKRQESREDSPNLAVVVPCFNEEEVLPETASRLRQLLAKLRAQGRIGEDSHVYFIDDGSNDATWELICNLADDDPLFRGIHLSRNRGHQNALLAGLLTAEGDVLISIDADLQDDLNAIGLMLDEHAQGAEIVYGVRRGRDTDTAFKRYSAEAYYRLLRLLGVDVVFNHADFRLMGRCAVEALREFGEVNIFLRGIVPQLGFPSKKVYYDRTERFAGETKYPLRKMLALALEGVTSFSAAPLRAITLLGLLIAFISLATTAWALGIRLFTDQAVPGWASTVVPIYFLGGIQLLCIGIIGEYMAKVYLEVKRRPRFIIERTTWGEKAGTDAIRDEQE